MTTAGSVSEMSSEIDLQKPSIMADEKTTETSLSEPDIAPDGGLRAWLVALGAAFIFFCVMGFTNSFGVFQEYFLTHQLRGATPDNIAWIGSLSFFLQFAFGAISGPLFDRYGSWLLRPAAVVFLFAVMMLSLCEKYWQFMLAQGVLIGIVTGFLLFPTMAAMSQFFDKKRGAAMGLGISGSSIGGVVFPILFSKLLNGSSLGYGWTMRIAGFIMLPLLILSCLFIRARLPPRRTNFFILSAFKELKFILLVTAIFFMLLGMFTPIFFIPTYAVSRGIDPTLASYLIAILNGASTFGRIIPGILADKFGRLNVLSLGGIMTGVIILCMTTVETTAAFVGYAIVFGFASGTIISGGGVAVTTCPKSPQDIGTYMGMGFGISSIAALIGPPVNGAFVHTYGGFWEATVFSGIVTILGGVVAFSTKLVTPEGLWGRF